MQNGRKLSIASIFFVVFLDMLGVGIVIPVFAPLFLNPVGILSPETTFATRTLLLGLLAACYPFAQFFGAPLLGALSDRYGRKKMLLVSQLGSVIGYALFAYAITIGSLPLIFMSRILDGFTGGNISIAMSAISDVSDPKKRAVNFGLMGMAFGLGFILGPYIGGKLADPSIISWFDAATPFWFTAILTMINMVQVLVRFHETLAVRRLTPISLFTGMRHVIRGFTMPRVRTLFMVIMLQTFGFTFFTQFFQVYLISEFHFTPGNIGDMFAYVGFCIAVVQGLVMRALGDHLSPRNILIWSLLGLSLIFPILIIPTSVAWLLVVMPFVAVFQGLTQPNLNALMSQQAGPEAQGEIIGISQSIQALAMTVPPIIAGIIVTMNIHLPIIVAGCTIFVAWLVFVWYYRGLKNVSYGSDYLGSGQGDAVVAAH